MKKKRTGNIYWANSKLIDKSDNKERRQYAVLRDNGKNVSVAKVRGFNNNSKNNSRLYELNITKYPLTKRSGIDNHLYSRRADNQALLELEDKQVFDSKPAFKMSSHDTHKSIEHARRKKRSKY